MATMWEIGLLANLKCRLSAAAVHGLGVVFSLLQDFQSTDQADDRAILNGLPFSSRNAYKTITANPVTIDNHGFIWSSKVSIKVKIFEWLLVRDRLNIKGNMKHKHLADDASCPRCSDPFEDVNH